MAVKRRNVILVCPCAWVEAIFWGVREVDDSPQDIQQRTKIKEPGKEERGLALAY